MLADMLKKPERMGFMRQRIKTSALKVFDEEGFHKAGIREIAAAAGCSLPTLYYHYGDKLRLYETVVCESYEALCEQISDQIPEGLPLRDTWFFSVMQRRLMTDDDRRVFRLALKAMLGVDNAGAATERLRTFEENRRAGDRERLIGEIGDKEYARIIIRVTDHMLQNALLEDDGLSQDDIRKEIDMLFDLAPGGRNHSNT